MRMLLSGALLILSSVAFSQSVEKMQDSIIEFINCPPEFPGGDQELILYLTNNFNVSDLDTSKINFGKLYVTFFVEANGSISELDIVNQSKKESVLRENVEPFSNMPIWKPACDRNGPVRERVLIPIVSDSQDL